MRNLYVKLLSRIFMINPFAKRLGGTLLWKLGTFICETWELVRVELLCRTLGNLTLYVEPELTFMSNLGNAELLRAQPLSPAARRSLGAVAAFLRCYTGKTSLKEGTILTQESTRRCDPKSSDTQYRRPTKKPKHRQMESQKRGREHS